MKKIFVILLSVMVISGCNAHTSKSYTYNVETGDKIKVELDTTNGYDLVDNEGKFKVKKDDKVISQAMFLTSEGYASLTNAVFDIADNEEIKNDSLKCLYYETDGNAGREYNYLCWIEESNTGIVIASLEGKDKAEEVFNLLKIIKE